MTVLQTVLVFGFIALDLVTIYLLFETSRLERTNLQTAIICELLNERIKQLEQEQVDERCD